MRYKDTDFLHASSRIAYMENQLITKEDLMKAVDADSPAEAFRLLSAKNLFKDCSINDYDRAFDKNMEETYRLIEEITNELGLTYIFRYPVDGHNMKVIVKDKIASGDFSDLYKPGGTVSAEVMKQELDGGSFEAVPELLGKAGLEAAEKLAKTKDSQIVDLIIDKAVIALMSRKSEEMDCEALTEYTKAKIDLINIKSALRLMRIKKDAYTAAKVFAEGGSFSVKELEQAYTMGYDGIKSLIVKMQNGERISEAVNEIKNGGSIGVFEKQSDECFRELFENTKIIPFGIEPVIAFLYLKDREIRACRLVLVSKIFGLSKEKITERLRYIYAD